MSGESADRRVGHGRLGQGRGHGEALLADHVGGFKVGLELLMSTGPRAIERIAATEIPVFADTKLHDIPNTVHRAATQVASAGARWLTVHASGGVEMVEAANNGMGGGGVLAVTVLTSLDQSDLVALGVTGGLDAQIRRLVGIAAAGRAEGIVCSPAEASIVNATGPQLTVFTPGVRPVGTGHHDQKRVADPFAAVVAGADYLVVGRPITTAEDPIAVAAAIVESATHAAEAQSHG